MTEVFRANVGIVLTNSSGEVLALERSPRGSGQWQLAQGGIENDEEPRQAMLRELEEEIGLTPDQIEVIAEHPDWLAYELPSKARSPKHGRGQVQKWFLLRLKDGEDATTVATAIPSDEGSSEFAYARWTTLSELAEETWFVRRGIYRRLSKDFAPYLCRI